MNTKHTHKFNFLLALLLCVPTLLNAQVEITEKPEYETLEQLLNYAKTLERRPYRSGATGPYAFDCSGFTQHCFKKMGIQLNRTSAQQAEQGKKIRNKKYLKPGDLVCFNGSKIGKDVGHVGIVVSTDGKEFSFIHASSSVGITISNSSVKYYEDRYLTGRRITSDKKIRRALKKFEEGTLNKPADQEAISERKARRQRRRNNAEAQTTDETKKTSVVDDSSNKQPKKQEQQQNIKPVQNDTKKDSTIVVPPVKNDTTPAVKDTTKEQQGTNVVSTLSGPYHTVVKGDTLYNIAKRAGCTVQQLQEWNNLTGNALSIGQVLRIKAE